MFGRGSGEVRKSWFVFAMMLLVLPGCSNSDDKEAPSDELANSMKAIFDYKINGVLESQSDELTRWLANARNSGEDGQYFMKQEAKGNRMYTYVYRKGYSDYEVSFIYEPSDPMMRGKVHVNGIKKSDADSFVQIKTVNDLSFLFILSDKSLNDKLKVVS